ncbi:MAG: flagellar basal body protein FliL [Geobacteraceae bacterium GWC2_48_7]|nr:MAG: flagellar basal body protein FliL [Geobacteraceae bacterium GWC2_48_7]
MAKDDQTAEGFEEEGGKKKKLIIIGAAVVVAIIIGVAAFMMMGKGKEAGKKDAKAGAHGEATPEAKGEVKAEGGGAQGAPAGGAAAGATNMFPLETFIVNIYDGQELRYLKVKLEVEMVSPAVKADLDARLAPIRDAILVLLSTKTLQDVQEIAGKNQLKDEILSSINKHIPPGKISKVYFTDFVVQ